MSLPRIVAPPGRILIPQIRADQDGFEFLASLSSSLGRYSSLGSIHLDFHEAVWIDGHMLAPLGAVLYMHTIMGNSVSFRNMQPNLESLFRKNGFLSAFADEVRTKDKWGTIIPYRRYVPSDERSFPTYMSKLAKNRGDLRFNDIAKNSLLMTTLEIFNNAVSHGRSSAGVFVCGQYYPNINRVRFSMADLGVGIRQNVSSFLNTAISGLDAIRWALERGNSTRLGRPGGMGLYFLRNFIESNSGKLSIVSGDSIISLGEEEYGMKTSRYFNGTYITLEINTNIPSVYLPVIEGENSNDLF